MRALSNPTVEINDEVIAIVANTFVFKGGKGEKTVRAASAGGNSIQPVITENAETKISMVKFEVYPTTVNVETQKTWQDSLDGLSVRASEGDFAINFRNMVLVNDPEVSLTADGTIELEFQGPPSV